MARIGHSSTRAALIYQHATRDRDRAIADALDVLIDAARRDRTMGSRSESGTILARDMINRWKQRRPGPAL
jgi:hypothetical protein